MKTVVQRVLSASVSVNGKVVSKIDKGYLVLVGIENGDCVQDVEKIANKLAALRIFSDENDKINLSIQDVGGSILAVSQFTLCADASHGNRPNFIKAAPPQQAKELFDKFTQFLRNKGIEVKEGLFGEHMLVALENDGPFTICLP